MGSYVSGRDTLVPDIEKTEPGTIVKIDKQTHEVDIDQYFRYLDQYDPQPVEDNLYSDWKQTLRRSFQRMIEAADGRQFIVGLSGGYDSRLIAVMLDLLEYDNVLLYTTGSCDGVEWKAASNIANDVGFDWIGIERNSDLGLRGYGTIEWHEQINKLGKSGMSHSLPKSRKISAIA